MKLRCQVKTPDARTVRRLAARLGLSPVTATVLVNRRITSVDQGSAFLNPTIQNLTPPFAIQDLDAAADRIARALKAGEPILVFGDYDVDGVTATVLLYEFLKEAGARVSYHIPHRVQEGYGLKAAHITGLAKEKGVGLIVTVDCGSSSHEAIDAARRCGIDVIVTDHHQLPEDLPPAAAVVNPKRPDCCAGLEELAGVGVAFALLVCLRKHLRDQGFWPGDAAPNLKQYCDLVALGTVADMVPLVAENRILTRAGLDLLQNPTRPGLKALIQESGLAGRPIDAEDIAFRLAPRLNAAGRMDHAKLAAELLLCRSVKAAREIARTLNEHNSARQQLESDILDEIERFLEAHPDRLEGASLVLARQNWHEGVLGIVAAKLARKYCRPAVLLSLRDGVGKGSARSIPGFDLYQGLVSCRSHLVAFGGHPMAAGLTLQPENLDRFRQAFDETVGRSTSEADFLPRIPVDCELSLDQVTDRLLDELEMLKPFGTGNEEPIFLARNVQVSYSALVGKHHRRMTLVQADSPNPKALTSIHFNAAPPFEDRFDVLAFRLRWNQWNGKRSAQAVVEEG